MWIGQVASQEVWEQPIKIWGQAQSEGQTQVWGPATEVQRWATGVQGPAEGVGGPARVACGIWELARELLSLD